MNNLPRKTEAQRYMAIGPTAIPIAHAHDGLHIIELLGKRHSNGVTTNRQVGITTTPTK
jgi:hypothetical protein